MNPLTNVKNIQKLNQRELALGNKKSWHDEYKHSAWIFVGGLPYDLSEGDIICVFSQYGEIVNINLVRDKQTGKSKGYCFICYEDQRSTVLAVDNLNAFQILGRTLRVDHVADYKKPKEKEDEDNVTKLLRTDGCGPNASLFNAHLKAVSTKEEDNPVVPIKKIKTENGDHKKSKKKKKKHSSKRKKSTSASAGDSDNR